MLQLRDTRITYAAQSPIVPGVRIEEEGLALVFKKVNGETCVQPSTGAAGEVFAGVSYERFAPGGRIPFIRQYSVPVGGVVQLPRVPAAGSIAVVSGSTTIAPTAGDERPTDETSIALNGDQLLLAEAAEGKTITVQMMYVPDVEEARAFQGDRPFGGHASLLVDSIGRLNDATVGTTCFDTTKDWTDVIKVGLGANGLFVPAAGANTLPNVVVANSPNAANATLVLHIKTP